MAVLVITTDQKGNWAPIHGVFDNRNRLWLLESSDKNEVRVTLVNPSTNVEQKTRNRLSVIQKSKQLKNNASNN